MIDTAWFLTRMGACSRGWELYGPLEVQAALDLASQYDEVHWFFKYVGDELPTYHDMTDLLAIVETCVARWQAWIDGRDRRLGWVVRVEWIGRLKVDVDNMDRFRRRLFEWVSAEEDLRYGRWVSVMGTRRSA